MSTYSKENNREEGTLSWLHRLFNPMKDDEINPPDEDAERNGKVNGSGTPRGGPPDDLKEGARSERWFDDADEQIEENKNLSRENRRILSRVDERTAWIMRLLVALFATVIGGAVLEFLLFSPA